MSPLLYCQRNYTADKNAKAAWAFAQVYPSLYPNADATYAYWVDKVYHVDLTAVPKVAKYMTNKIDDVVYDATVAATLEGYFEIGYQWWDEGEFADPTWSAFAFYNGSTRASFYSNNPDSEERVGVIGIFNPSQLWRDTHNPSSN
jgi:hypothetical protein